MPNIKEYQAPALDIRPTEVGVEATAAAARRGGTFFSEAAGALRDVGNRLGSTLRDAGDAAVSYMQHREISAGAPNFATMRDNLTTNWNDTVKNADPNDPSVAGKFRDEVLNPAIDKFKESFTTQGGQNWAESHTDNLRNHFFEKTSADMSMMAGKAAIVNSTQTLNKLTNTTYNDPSSLDDSLGVLKSTFDGITKSSPTLSPAAAANISTQVMEKGGKQLVHAAISSTIANGGDWKRIADKYPEYIDRQEIETFVRAEKVQQRADKITQKQLEIYGKQQATEAAHELISQSMTKHISYDDANNAIIKPGFANDLLDIERQYPGLATDKVRSMINWAQREQRERPIVNKSKPEVMAQLLDGISDPSNTARESDIDIWGAASRGDLSNHDRQNLLGLNKASASLKEPILQSGLKAAKEQLGYNVVPDGASRYHSFLQTFQPEYDRQRRAGTLPPNALNTNDPTSLISESMKAFRPTPQQMMEGHFLKRSGISSLEGLGDAMNPLPNRPLNLAPGSPDREGDQIPTITTKEQYDALPPGAPFREKGKLFKKPEGKK